VDEVLELYQFPVEVGTPVFVLAPVGPVEREHFAQFFESSTL
jgi:hypothetical protein